MAARYLIRFDDVCPTMNWSVWADVERILESSHLRPILAVVPDNRDAKLQVDSARADFWGRVREWQSRGWGIGLHGYQHLYNSASAGLVGIHEGSEFAGLPEHEQRAKLQSAVRIFQEQSVRPDVWIAPGHSFDMTTVALLPEVGIDAISDGFYWRSLRHAGCRWIPQQLWRFRSMPFGTWTVCFHINSWKPRDLERFERAVSEYGNAIVSLSDVLQTQMPDRNTIDRAFSNLFRRAVLARQRGAVSSAH
jgi:predicted deacetylase